MPTNALLLGSIGVLAETSDLQRQAFNAAFSEHGLDWCWDAETYRALLEVPGGKARIRYYGLARGVEVDVESLYDAKIAAFARALRAGVDMRPGIRELIADARSQKMKVALVSSTDRRQIGMVLDALRGGISAADFDFVGDRSKVMAVKPAPDIYRVALRDLGVAAPDAVALEDTPESAASPRAVGIRTFAYPGEAARGRAFTADVGVLDRPDARILSRTAAAA